MDGASILFAQSIITSCSPLLVTQRLQGIGERNLQGHWKVRSAAGSGLSPREIAMLLDITSNWLGLAEVEGERMLCLPLPQPPLILDETSHMLLSQRSGMT